MSPRIEMLSEKKFIGMNCIMSFANNRTSQLWHSFMPRRKEIANTLGTELYSMEVYHNPLFFKNFNPTNEFEKWAAVEVLDINIVPIGMKTLIVPTGLYAVFTHRGPASEGEKTYNSIFRTWLPNSIYDLDDRQHFAIMGDKYKNNDPDSEEEIWIPIKPKDI